MRWRRLFPTFLSLLAIGLGGAAWSACGGDDDAQQGSGGQTADRAAQGATSSEAGTADRADSDETGGSDHSSAGGSGATGSGGGGGGDGGNGPYQPDPDSAEGRANSAVGQVYDVLEARGELDGATLCGLMTARAQRQATRYAEVSSGIAKDWDCEQAVGQLVDRTRRAGAFDRVRRAEVIGINVADGRATATIRFGGGPATTLPLSRVDGQWKLDVAPSGRG